MKYYKEKVLIIDGNSLPDNIQISFGNRRKYLNWDHPIDLESISWFSAQTLNQASLEEYYEKEKTLSSVPFKGSLEDFIISYQLELEKFLIDSKIDFSDITRIFIQYY